jgi:hypothetical protein
MKVLACLSAVVIFLALRSTLKDNMQKVVTTAVSDHAAECLVMAGNTTREVEGSTYIVGSFENRCDRKFDQVTIGFLIDQPLDAKFKSDAPVLAYVRSVQPGERRDFKTMFRIEKNATYRFDKITAF